MMKANKDSLLKEVEIPALDPSRYGRSLLVVPWFFNPFPGGGNQKLKVIIPAGSVSWTREIELYNFTCLGIGSNKFAFSGYIQLYHLVNPKGQNRDAIEVTSYLLGITEEDVKHLETPVGLIVYIDPVAPQALMILKE